MFHRTISGVLYCALVALAAVPGATAAPPAGAEPTAKPTQRAPQSGVTSFVWTNDEIDMLRENNVPISIVGLQPGAEPATVAAAPGEIESYDRSKDPEWYADQAAILRAELDARQGALQQQQDAIAEARNERRTDPGVAMDRGNAGITPEAGVENLETGVREVEDQLDALADLARQNDIPPGVLRG